MKRHLARNVAAGIAAFATVIAVSACAAEPEQDTELTHIVVAMQPVTPFVNVPLGVSEGIFEKYGLDVQVRVISEAATIPPAVLADQVQFAAWSYASFTSLANSGLPLITVGPGDTAGTDLRTDYTQLITMPDSGVKETADLEGKTVATNSLNSLSHVQTIIALENAGVDVSTVTFVPIPYASQGAALEAGQIDAAQVAEPFLTKYAEELDAVALDALDAAIMPDLPVSTWFTSQKYAQENPEIVEAFQRALWESSEFAQANSDAVRAYIPGFSGVEKEIAAKMILPTWVTEVDLATIQSIADTMFKFGAIDAEIDMSQYVLASPEREDEG